MDKEERTDQMPIGFFPGVRREGLVAALKTDATEVDSADLTLRWEDMTLQFTSPRELSEATLLAAFPFDVGLFEERLNSILPFCERVPGSRWVLDWQGELDKLGDYHRVSRVFCDQVYSVDFERGETLGGLESRDGWLMKRYSTVRLSWTENVYHVFFRASSAKSLKRLWLGFRERLDILTTEARKRALKDKVIGIGD